MKRMLGVVVALVLAFWLIPPAWAQQDTLARSRRPAS